MGLPARTCLWVKAYERERGVESDGVPATAGRGGTPGASTRGMSMAGRSVGLALLSGALACSLLLACGGGGARPLGCAGEEDDPCAPAGRCLGGSCVQDAAPTAAFTVPAGVKALELTTLDGSASADPDAALGDEVRSHDWSFSAAGAPCAPPQVSGHANLAQVRFPCAGHFTAQLIVTDALGMASAPVTHDVDVVEGSSLVRASADQGVNHRCAGEPMACTVDGADPTVTASVNAGITTVGALRYDWVARRPSGGELGPSRLVTFPAGAPAGSSRVHIETAGPLIVDDWPIDVSISDDAGPLGSATTRISVGNRAPTATTVAAVSVDHVYTGGSYRATATGVKFVDPDGDALTPEATGSTLCPGFSLGGDGTAQILCQKASGGTLGLNGFVGSQTVSQRVKDPWGLESPARSTAVTILNRAPTATSSATNALRNCAEGSCCQTEAEPPHTCMVYALRCDPLAATPHPSVLDPDGDPVLLTWVSGALGTGSSVCEPSACAGAYAVPGGGGCAGPPTGSTSGTFMASDGLTTSGQATLTLTW